MSRKSGSLVYPEPLGPPLPVAGWPYLFSAVLYGSQTKIFPFRLLHDWVSSPRWNLFTARYDLKLLTQFGLILVLKRLILVNLFLGILSLVTLLTACTVSENVLQFVWRGVLIYVCPSTRDVGAPNRFILSAQVVWGERPQTVGVYQAFPLNVYCGLPYFRGHL